MKPNSNLLKLGGDSKLSFRPEMNYQKACKLRLKIGVCSPIAEGSIQDSRLSVRRFPMKGLRAIGDEGRFGTPQKMENWETSFMDGP